MEQDSVADDGSQGGRSAIEPRGSGGSSRSSDYELGDTFSVDSSITQYRMENGRRYHAYKDGTYWAPNDDRQNENLDITHHKFFLLLSNKLLLAPISKDISHALDIGTGTGIWAIDFADEWPNTQIIGTDLSPIQPNLVPPNLRFEIDDARDEWTYPLDYFDYVHIRCLFGSIEDWPALYNQAYKHMKPGAWIEQLEVSIDLTSDDGTLKDDDPIKRFVNLFREAGSITGQTFRVFNRMRGDITRAGFINVTEKIYKLPLGGWAKDERMRELGQWNLLGFDTGLEGYALATLTRVLGWNTAEVQVFLAQCRTAARDRKTHSYHEVKVVYAQKPFPAEAAATTPVPAASGSS